MAGQRPQAAKIVALLGEVAFCAKGWVGESGNKWEVLEYVDENVGGS